ncbi:uncharacterized protein BO88DRAFT_479644 [Aspergillus vadensis CBS 113365]|uniref:Secreted protein n=1 Tax=Aspergillus vadensis (strain CBS 113365 / IMI 142717 / IBT 24658) TaxID=1448311 RepID=A0A319BBV9_ASPVC|nr:hypothetical protein BO88DRAFT_479644 [Aspergillus vadensis CBS 113365]PYH70546.1 hypothetical protein BO88DRAFT_479644 [Aspergillus vadensis CBS 113365]
MNMKLLYGALLIAQAAAAASSHGTFVSPANDVRLKFRYWLPDASVDTDTVVKDIEEAGAIGAGGLELLGLYNYGGSLAPQPDGANWATAKDTGMIFDFALGPSQGQGVPAKTTDEGLHWDLAPFNVSVPSNGTYNGQIPGWGTGELVSLVSARVVNTSTIVNPASSLFSTPANNATRVILATESLVDYTDVVSANGMVSLSFNVSEHYSYRLFAYYQYQDLVKNLDIYENTTGSIFDNGSYTVDHFSARGAQTTIDFWENYILNDTDIKALLEEVGRYGWEDSIEIKSNISWSPTIPDIFEQINGYQLRKFLPLVMHGNNNPGVQPSYPGTLKCVLDSEDQGQGYVNDFRAALEKGYQNYLDTLSTWLEGLGLGYSAQVSYNLPLNMEVSINHVVAPECESLAFNNNIDGYRQFSGVANLAQKNVISNEMGANLEKAFALPLSELLGHINTAFAGGVNQIVLHGQSYTGNYHETTWPGYTSFFMLFAESYYNKQPAWGHGLSDAIDYVSRNQYILQAGQPRTDIALYNGVSMTDPQLETMYPTDDLIKTGYTYTYLSPANFNLSQASVSNGLLASESPAYKAIVVTSDQNATLAGVMKLQQYANSGLPVILSGGFPGYYHNEIPLHIAANQTVAFAFSNGLWSEIETPYFHALRVPSNVLGYNYSTSGGLLLHTSTDPCNDCIFQLSNGTAFDLSLNSTSLTSHLRNWTLIAEHWEAPSNISDAAIQAVKRNTTHHLETLVSWLDIPGLQNASGLGYYSTSFSWPPNSADNVDGAYLTFPKIAQGIKVTVNGHDVGSLDFTNPSIDIGPYLISGSNEVTAIVPTLMWNYIRSIYDEIEISGIAPLLSDPLPDRVDNGLIGEVKIIPYIICRYMI